MLPPKRGGLLKRREKDVQKRVSHNCEEIVDLTKYLSDLRWGVYRETVDLTKYLSELRWGVRREIVDLTKYLSGQGWRVKKLRGSNNCEEIIDLTKYLSDLRWGVYRETVDLTKYLSELRWGVRREIVDLTEYLSERGWRVKKLRGSNKGTRSESPIVRRVRHKWNMDQFSHMIEKDQDKIKVECKKVMKIGKA